jgi:hypothetical protein
MLMEACEGFRPLSPQRRIQISNVEPSQGVLRID